MGTTVFLTTHYLDEADVLCDRLFVIDHGETVAVGTPDELKRQVSGDVVTLRVYGPVETARSLLALQPIVREVSLADGALRLSVEHGEEALPALLRVLDRAGITIAAISLSRPTLDDVFLTLTGRSLRDDSPGPQDKAEAQAPGLAAADGPGGPPGAPGGAAGTEGAGRIRRAGGTRRAGKSGGAGGTGNGNGGTGRTGAGRHRLNG